jgi:hypothetical protein
MKPVLRAEVPIALNAEEPTQRVGPSIEEWGLVPEEEAKALHSLLDSIEYNIVDLLIPHERLEVFLRVFIGLDCLHLLELRVRGCGSEAATVKRLADSPEYTRISMEGDCIEIGAPADVRTRIVNALSKLGIAPPVKPIAYRAVRKLVLEE